MSLKKLVNCKGGLSLILDFFFFSASILALDQKAFTAALHIDIFWTSIVHKGSEKTSSTKHLANFLYLIGQLYLSNKKILCKAHLHVKWNFFQYYQYFFVYLPPNRLSRSEALHNQKIKVYFRLIFYNLIKITAEYTNLTKSGFNNQF